MAPYNKTAKRIYTSILLICIAVFGTLLSLHSVFIYKSTDNLDTLHLALFLIGLFVIQQLYYAILSLGFLIFGKISGYKMAFLRIAFMKWTKDEKGKIHFSTTNERGPSSKCGMYPPDMIDGKMPYLLYGHGFVILASIFIVISAIFFYFSTPVISSLLLVFIFVLLTFVFMDLCIGSAKSTRDISKSPYAIKGLWISCKLADPDFNNTSISHMPDEWFGLTHDGNINTYWASFYLLCCGERLLDQMQFKEASELLDMVLGPDSRLNNEQYVGTISDRLFCELMTNRNPQIIEKLYTPEFKNYLSNVRTYTNLCRNYAFTLFIEHNPTGAAQIKAEFFEVGRHTPYQGDVKGETELLLYAENKYFSEVNS